MAQIDFLAHTLAGAPQARDGASQPRVVRLDSTTYGVKGAEEDRWHWVHRAPARQRWTCGCAHRPHCWHIAHVLQNVRYRELWRAI